MKLARISRELAKECDALTFAAPVTHVYNPLVYARAPHEAYLERYGAGKKRTLLLGMNPGPFGMAQTGVPFGEVSLVRDWLGIEGKVDKPPHEHPKRPIDGFACKRSEVSGARLWGWARERFGAPERFFARFFVVNYCPLVFMEASARNRTPDKLRPDERVKLYAACDRAVKRIAQELEPERVIGVGAFAEDRAREALAGSAVKFGRILHPSPASPLANNDWGGQVDRQLAEMGIKI